MSDEIDPIEAVIKDLYKKIEKLEEFDKIHFRADKDYDRRYNERIKGLREYIKINTANIQDNFKGFKDFKFLQESQMKRSDHLQEQINELEKKLEAERKTKIWDTKVINKMNKGIDELKDWFLEYHDYELEKVNNELNELKEDIKGALDYTTRWAKNLENVEEVLRELYNHIDPACLVFDDETTERLDWLDKQLEKLDGKTEKKEDCKHDWVNTFLDRFGQTNLSKNRTCLKCGKTIKKASGGEKSQFVKDVENFQESLDVRSKMPEPTPTELAKEYTKEQDRLYDELHEPKYLDKMRDDVWEALNEPREDGYDWVKHMNKALGVNTSWYTIVKREKIEFWRKEILNKTDDVLKSMREVLGIE